VTPDEMRSLLDEGAAAMYAGALCAAGLPLAAAFEEAVPSAAEARSSALRSYRSSSSSSRSASSS